MSAYTPGPWIRFIGGPIMAYGSVDTVSCAVLIPVAVAKPTSDYDSDGRHFTLPGCPAANSMLIAAAPDMLAALKLVSGLDIFHEAQRVVDAAIAAAEGRP